MPKVEVSLKDKLLLYYEEAAAMLSMSEPTLRELIKIGLIDRVQVKSSSKIYIEDLHEFCRKMRNKKIDPSAPVDEIIRNLT